MKLSESLPVTPGFASTAPKQNAHYRQPQGRLSASPDNAAFCSLPPRLPSGFAFGEIRAPPSTPYRRHPRSKPREGGLCSRPRTLATSLLLVRGRKGDLDAPSRGPGSDGCAHLRSLRKSARAASCKASLHRSLEEAAASAFFGHPESLRP